MLQQGVCVLSGLVAPLWLSRPAWAQDRFPSKPIRLIVPWPSGGSSDAVMRAFAESVGNVLDVPVVVENRPGASGTLGAVAMVTARPDGYTLTQLPLGVYRLPHMQKTPYDPIHDLTHIVGLAGYTFGLVAAPDAPFKTLKEMVAYAKAHPGMLEYGSTGIGTTPHLAIEAFSREAGIQLNHVPYKGTAELLQAILAGQIRLMCGSTEFMPYVKEGRLRLLATLGRKRSKWFADVPTIHEAGWDTVSESPYGIGGPRDMDPAVVKILQDAFRKTLDDPKLLDVLDRYAQPVIYMNSEEYRHYAQHTFEVERQTIERLGLSKKG